MDGMRPGVGTCLRLRLGRLPLWQIGCVLLLVERKKAGSGMCSVTSVTCAASWLWRLFGRAALVAIILESLLTPGTGTSSLRRTGTWVTY